MTGRWTPTTRFRAIDKVPGRGRFEYVQTVDRIERNRVFEESWDGPMGGHSLIRFDGDGDETVISIQAEVASPVPGALSILEPLANRLALRMFGQDLDRLEELVLEGRQSGTVK